MTDLTVEIPAISDLALEVMMRVIDENKATNKIQDENAGPVPLAAALSDLFEIASSLENSEQYVEQEVISELAHYALDLLDRLGHQLLVLDIHDQRDKMARIFVSMSLWLVRRDAILDNMAGAADGFANLVNAEQNTGELARLALLIQEVLDAAADEMQQDEDRSDTWRPWRVLNLNAGIAATRSLDPQLMRETFEVLERRLPYDMPGFFNDGRRQMIGQNIPDEVQQVMQEYADKWPPKPLH